MALRRLSPQTSLRRVSSSASHCWTRNFPESQCPFNIRESCCWLQYTARADSSHEKRLVRIAEVDLLHLLVIDDLGLRPLKGDESISLLTFYEVIRRSIRARGHGHHLNRDTDTRTRCASAQALGEGGVRGKFGPPVTSDNVQLSLVRVRAEMGFSAQSGPAAGFFAYCPRTAGVALAN